MVPAPTTATNEVPVFEVIDETGVPPTFTLAAVVPVKFVPIIVIEVPGHPVVGEMEVIVGGGGGVHLKIRPLDGILLVAFCEEPQETVFVLAVPANKPFHCAIDPEQFLKSLAPDPPRIPISQALVVVVPAALLYIISITFVVSYNLI